MGINLASEHVLSFLTLAARLPAGRRGRRVNVSTIHRWRLRGLRGCRLEAIRIGGRWVTSLEAAQRFFDALSRTKGSLPALLATVQPATGSETIARALEAEGL